MVCEENVMATDSYSVAILETRLQICILFIVTIVTNRCSYWDNNLFCCLHICFCDNDCFVIVGAIH